jgi:hypothetical protein
LLWLRNVKKRHFEFCTCYYNKLAIFQYGGHARQI